MKQAIYEKNGRVRVKDVPVPEIGVNEILVKNSFSVISAGTEKSMLKLMKKPLWKMAIDRPDLTSQVIRFAKDSGVKKTMDLVRSRLDVWHLLGYSSAGVVVKSGENVKDIGAGDMVACIGSGFANHADYVAVPKNLIAKIPKGVKPEDAAFTGIGCIALQSIRHLNPQLGENIAVIGLGLIGQITAQMLRANGCKVIGIDLDKAKTEKGYIDEPISEDTIKNVLKTTGGTGADGVIITAATKHNLLNDAFDMCRKRAKVVLLGVCGMEIDRQKMFDKEIDFTVSQAFGAGTFDINFEELGKTYPIEYARWTSQENMKAVLELLKTKKLDVSEMRKNMYKISNAKEAYNDINEGKTTSALFQYDPKDDSQTTELKDYKKKGKINTAIIGAGQFVKAFILPEIRKNPYLSLYAIVTKSGTNAKKLTEKYNAKLASTSYKDIINDKNVDLIIIGTRHESHAEISKEALKKNKHVFSEKPMAISIGEFRELASVIEKSDRIYSCGFNRRYSPAMKKIKGELKKDMPMMINYVFNNTYLPKDHWVNQPEIGGGRVIGEACHIIDLFGFLTGSTPITIYAQKIASSGKGQINDDNNIMAVIKYRDGSVCTLTYSCMGNNKSQRERCTIFQDGNVLEMNGFSEIMKNNRKIFSGKADEGHAGEIKELAKKIRGRENNLVTADECITTTDTVFRIIKSIRNQK